MESARLYRLQSHRQRIAGFTLIELMVVLVIITFITLVVLTSQSNFNKSLILANTAYDVALTVRTAEIFGLGSRASNASTNVGYGLHFVPSSSQFILFIDSEPVSAINNGDGVDQCHSLGVIDASDTGGDPTKSPDAKAGNCIYNAGVDGKIQEYTLGNKITVGRVCITKNALTKCNDDADGPATLDVVFSRPNPKPNFSTGGVYSKAANVSSSCVELTSAEGAVRTVSISASGQVVVGDPNIPCNG